MENITIEDFGPNQCQVKVGKHRVAYVCYGENKPINFLPKSVTGLKLTDAEKLTVAKKVRSVMDGRTQDKDSVSDELAQLTSSSYSKEKSDGDSTQQGSNPKRGNKTKD